MTLTNYRRQSVMNIAIVLVEQMSQGESRIGFECARDGRVSEAVNQTGSQGSVVLWLTCSLLRSHFISISRCSQAGIAFSHLTIVALGHISIFRGNQSSEKFSELPGSPARNSES